MADVKITCPNCGQENTFSEYVSDDVKVCFKCEASLADNVMAHTSSLKVKKTVEQPEATHDLSPVPVAQMKKEAPKKGKSKSKAMAPTQEWLKMHDKGNPLIDKQREQDAGVKIKGPSFIIGMFLFVLCTCLFVGFQYMAVQNNQYMSIYLNARYVVIAIASLLILYEAWCDSHVKCILCIIVPMYIVFYALSHVDTFWRQGIFLAMLAMLGAEMYFLPEDAVFTIVSIFVNDRIKDVADALENAGAAPVRVE